MRAMVLAAGLGPHPPPPTDETPQPHGSRAHERLGSAGSARNCRDFLTADGAFLLISPDAVTGIDLGRFAERHRTAGGVATLAVKRSDAINEHRVVLHDAEGRVCGFQDRPNPAEALSDLCNCGIYLFEPEIFDYFPPEPFVDWAQHVFPALLEHDVPFFVHELPE